MGLSDNGLSMETVAADGYCSFRRFRSSVVTELIQNDVRLRINNGGNIEVIIIGVYQGLF
jgi:hypothetical protein